MVEISFICDNICIFSKNVYTLVCKGFTYKNIKRIMDKSVEKAVSATQSNSQNYITFQIKPFKDNERTFSHWQKVIENLISLKSKSITFLINGNNQ